MKPCQFFLPNTARSEIIDVLDEGFWPSRASVARAPLASDESAVPRHYSTLYSVYSENLITLYTMLHTHSVT